MTRRFCLIVLCLLSFGISAEGLKGDSEALLLVDRMFEAIGGRDAWAEARSLHTVERARHPSIGDGIIASFWRDLEQPGEYARLDHSELDVTYAWTNAGGWMMRDKKVRDFTHEEMTERIENWHREIYTLYHQLAKGERALQVKFISDNAFDVYDEKAEHIGSFRLTPSGDLYYWQQVGGDNPVAYVYGPHRSYGEIEFPDWGTSTTGDWGFYYLQVQPSSKSFASHVNLTKPGDKSDWSGGAIRIRKSNCTEND